MALSPKNRWVFGVAVLVSAMALGGCRHGSNGDAASVRLIDAVPDQGNLSVSVAGESVWKNSSYGSNTGYQQVKPGTYDLDVTSDAGNSYKSISFDKNQKYTVLALGTPNHAGVTFRVYPDVDANPVPDGKSRLYFINAVSGPEEFDLLVNNVVAVTEVPYAHRSEPLLLGSGPYDFRVNRSDTVQTVLGPSQENLSSGHTYTLVAMGTSPSALQLQGYADAP